MTISAAAGVDAAVVDMMESVFAEYRDAHPPSKVVERDGQLWETLDQLGLVRLTGAEAVGGSGAGWHEAAELLSAAVRHGVRIPLAEHDLLACWLLEANGMATDAAVRTVCVLDETGTAKAVPWAASSDRIVIVWHDEGGPRVTDVETSSLRITPDSNMIGEPRDAVAADIRELRGELLAPELASQLGLRSALVRAIQVCAAIDRALDLSVEHAASRVQFGRPLTKFQAVQNLISDMAGEAALARAATEAALDAAAAGDWSAANVEFLIAVARSCAGHAASVVVRNAHQVHGAIGTTREHRLHEFTRAALAWRSEFGSVRHWDDRLTDAALRSGAVGLWPLITG